MSRRAVGQHPDCLDSRDFSSSVTNAAQTCWRCNRRTPERPVAAGSRVTRSLGAAIAVSAPSSRGHMLAASSLGYISALGGRRPACLGSTSSHSCRPRFLSPHLLSSGDFYVLQGLFSVRGAFLAPFLRDIICHHQGWIVLRVTCDCTCVHPKGFPAQSL